MNELQNLINEYRERRLSKDFSRLVQEQYMGAVMACVAEIISAAPSLEEF